jgi:hypothetical protein
MTEEHKKSWAEQRAEKLERYEVAVEERRAAIQAYTDSCDALLVLEIRLRGEVYGDGSDWTGADDPRIRAGVIARPEWKPVWDELQAARRRLVDSEAALCIANPPLGVSD